MSVDTHTVAMWASILLTAGSQLLLKHGSSGRAGLLGAMVHPSVLLGYGCFIVVTLCSVYALVEVELKVLTAWGGVTHPLVMLGAASFLGERVGWRGMVGVLLVAVGIVVFSL
ncbi:MAG: hypothetical protein AAGI01_00285 [Myxococcota bacterium]